MENDLLLLLIYSNPDDTDPLRLDRERRSFGAAAERARLSPTRYKILEAATFDDVLRTIPDQPFSLIHFSGHGEKTGLFVEEGDTDCSVLASVDMIEKILEAARPHLKIAVFLACFASEYADRLIAQVPYILATVGPADDRACVQFVDCFYTRLLAGDGVETAYIHARGRVSNLEVALLRRAEHDGRARALVHSSSFPGHPTIYVDISAVEEDAERLGLSSDELIQLMARKIYYHAFAFRYPRSDAILSIGNIFAAFSWHDSADAIACTRLYKLKADVNENLAQAFVELLIAYSDSYVAQYRSPSARFNPHYEDQVLSGLKRMISSYRYFFGYTSDTEPEPPFLTARRKVMTELLSHCCPDVYRTVRAIGNAHLVNAERKYVSKDMGGTIAHLEAALSSLHDLNNAISKLILE